MIDSPARRPWWKKKRWWLAGAIWLPVVYALGYGPVLYAATRGMIPQPYAYRIINGYAPLRAVIWDAGHRPRPGLAWCDAYYGLFVAPPPPDPRPPAPAHPAYSPDRAIDRTHWQPPEHGP